jgi:hypothetical protein
VLVTLLALADGRVREQLIWQAHSGVPAVEVVDTGRRVQALADVVLDAVTDVARMHTALTVFIVVAAVLTIFMVRT